MNRTRKIVLVSILLIGMAAVGAFALDISIGASGALYMSEEAFDAASSREIWAGFEQGEGVFAGVNLELLFSKWGLGLYTYFSFYEDYHDETLSTTWTYEMMDSDVSLGLSYHIFGSTFFLDPFLEGGFGLISKNINAAYVGGEQFYGDVEDQEPIMIQGTEYWYAGAGLGINVGSLGAFLKVQYHAPIGAPEVETTENSFYIPDEFPLDDLKVILGGKLIF